MNHFRRDLNEILSGEGGAVLAILMWFGILSMVAVLALTAADIAARFAA